LPVSADVKSDDDLRFEALDLTIILGLIENKSRVSLLFLDACREDPFKQRLGLSRDLSPAGLAPAHATGSGTFIAFATAPGSVAADGSGEHSPFTAAMLQFIETPGLEVRQMMSKVRGEVEAVTDGKQIPWDSSSLRGDFFFDPKTTGDKVIQAINGPNPQVDLDALYWESVKNSKNPKNFSAYLLKFPQGVFAEIARNRLTELNVAPPAPAPTNPKVVTALSTLAAPATQKDREAVAAAYQAGGPHKSLAVNLSNGGASWVAGLESEQAAEESVLERCEVRHGGPCVLVVVDEDIKYASGDQIAPRPMSRVHYAGSFNPERIPSLPADVRRRPDVLGYASASNFKAAAYHPVGRIFITTGASSQLAAEEQVLTACNNDPSRQNQNKVTPCYLYAAGTDVVLSRLSRTPIVVTASAADTPVAEPLVIEPVKPPSVIVPAKEAVPLLDAIVAQLERALPAMTVASRDLTAKTYESAPPHKALVLRPVAELIALSAGRRRKERSKPHWRDVRSITVPRVHCWRSIMCTGRIRAATSSCATCRWFTTSAHSPSTAFLESHPASAPAPMFKAMRRHRNQRPWPSILGAEFIRSPARPIKTMPRPVRSPPATEIPDAKVKAALAISTPRPIWSFSISVISSRSRHWSCRSARNRPLRFR